jgi:hypothetical protein
MNDISLAAQAAAWQGALMRTASLCATYYARRAPHWIGISSRLWAQRPEESPLPGRSLPEELMTVAGHEVELRGEFTKRMLGELAERHVHLPTAQVLVDCTKLASELLRDGCRDVDNDIVRASRFLHGMDGGVVAVAVKAAISRVTDHLLEVTGQRPEPI